MIMYSCWEMRVWDHHDNMTDSQIRAQTGGLGGREGQGERLNMRVMEAETLDTQDITLLIRFI